MSNLQEKVLFSQRLKQALQDADHPISPTYLSKQFNYRYDGTPVSIQSANNWLLGKAIPSQDKLSILAIWLNISSQWLRFGEETTQQNTVSEPLASDEVIFLIKYKSLSSAQQKIVKDLIEQFHKC
ncbi:MULTISPECIES: hypothetical protein [Acinetobacter]|uniref:hypothetical protein n=1 Tax=Acinetobacter TaxID=469 RepID=UPI0015D27801|nr:hypothetical protein [Acinetobacter sp. YH01012]